jgi:hypothetical protein
MVVIGESRDGCMALFCRSLSHNRYMVSFDAAPMPIVLEVASNSLWVEHAVAALPRDAPIPSLANILMNLQENAHAQEMIDKDIQDQEEEEHLLEFTPESEDVEEEKTGRNKEDGAEPPNSELPVPVANNYIPSTQHHSKPPETEG